MSRSRIHVLLLAALASTSACSAAVADRNAATLGRPATTVEVVNNNWSDMVVYATNGGTRHRLGTVISMTSRRLRVPAVLTWSPEGIRLEVDPIGSSQGFVTPAVMVNPGDRISFTIQNHLAISSLAVRSR